MLPKYHIFFSLIFSVLIAFLFNLTFFQISLVFLSSIFLDLDHYFRYVFLTKRICPIGFWKESMERMRKWKKISQKEKNRIKKPIFIFHGIEFLILLIILSLFYEIFLFVVLGMLFHLLLDYVDLLKRKEPLSLKISQIYVWKTNKKKLNFDSTLLSRKK
jgi:hypothetical protein